MTKYNKNAKLIYMLLGVLILATLATTIVYMTQYKNLFLFKSIIGFSENTNNINNNTDWRDFITSDNSVIVEIRNMLGYSGVATKDVFVQTANNIYTTYIALNTVNQLLLYFTIVSAVMFASLFIASNHSRRIYYASNYVIGIVAPAVVAVFALVVAVFNTLLIPVISNNHLLLNAMDYVCSNNSASYIKDINLILNHNVVNSTTLILVDVLLAAIIGYCAYLITYAIKRYNICAAERDEIIAKAVSNNE